MSQVNKYLYHTFDHWFRGGNIWIYSDPHFDDKEMKNIRKNYISDEEQVKRINSKVGKNDTIIFLGDVGNVEYIKKIRGYKILITGNHDLGKSNYMRMAQVETSGCAGKKIVFTGSYKDCVDFVYEDSNFTYGNIGHVINDNNLFDEVYHGPIMIAPKVMLSHEPIDCPYFFSIHGHDHSNWFDNGHHFNACAEWLDYTPVSLLDMFKKGMFKNVDDIHRMTIDKATDRKAKRLAKLTDSLA